jgi:hypothetical protein
MVTASLGILSSSFEGGINLSWRLYFRQTFSARTPSKKTWMINFECNDFGFYELRFMVAVENGSVRIPIQIPHAQPTHSNKAHTQKHTHTSITMVF